MLLTVCPNPSVDILANINEIEPSAVNRILEETHFPGGKGVHVALAMAEMKLKPTLFAFWGGPTGEWIQTECRKTGINPKGIEVDGWNQKLLYIQIKKSEIR